MDWLQEDELGQCFERRKETWEPEERKTEVIVENASKLSQSIDGSSHFVPRSLRNFAFAFAQ